MKKSIKNVLMISLKLLLVASIILSSYELLNKVFYNKEVSNGEKFKNLPKNSIDVIVLGSSHAQYSFVPAFFFEETGLNSYVLGTSCQPYQVSYEMLKEALKTQQPQMVIMEVFTALPLRSSCAGDFCYIMAEYQMTGREKINVIKMLPEEKEKLYLNDFFTNHNQWKTIESLDNFFEENSTETDSTFGYIFQHAKTKLPDNWWHASQYGYDVDIELDENDKESLNAIYDLCQKNNIELLLYKTPVDSFTREDQSMLHKVWEWADEHNVDYIDFLKESKSLSFYMGIHSDAFHAYINGASMITRRISDEVNKYGISPSLETFKEQYEKTERVFTSYALRYETYPIVYLKRLENTSGVVALSYNSYGEPLYNSLYTSLLSLGLDGTLFTNNSSYCAIIVDGKVVSEGKDSAEVHNESYDISVTKAGITINGEDFAHKTSLMITYYNQDTGDIVKKNIDQQANMDYGQDFYDWDNNLAF